MEALGAESRNISRNNEAPPFSLLLCTAGQLAECRACTFFLAYITRRNPCIWKYSLASRKMRSCSQQLEWMNYFSSSACRFSLWGQILRNRGISNCFLPGASTIVETTGYYWKFYQKKLSANVRTILSLTTCILLLWL